MASHLTSIGFNVENRDEFIALFKLAHKNGVFEKSNIGTYVKWQIDNCIELYGQYSNENKPIGMNPHYFGEARQIVKIEEIIRNNDDSELDGRLKCWADPNAENGGIFPFVFECPDIDKHKEIKLPQNIEIQVTGFAHDIEVFDNENEFMENQENDLKFATESFIPSGLFELNDNPKAPIEAMAIINGKVIKNELRINSYTKLTNQYALIEVQGCRFDVVIDNSLLKKEIVTGGIISGSFWLTGVITSPYKKQKKKKIFNFFGK